MASPRYLEIFQSAATENPSLSWFAIVDSSQYAGLPPKLLSNLTSIRCLFQSPVGSELSKYTPHLVQLDTPLKIDYAWKWIHRKASQSSSLSIIAANRTFESLYIQLTGCKEVTLPDGETMFLAFWDPAILGTLIGQADDKSLHIPGPVFNLEQRAMLTDEVAYWWYWDRIGEMHEVRGETKHVSGLQSIQLNQNQVDDLVEASVPDHILYYLSLNQPQLIDKIDPFERYEIVRKALAQARDVRLTQMRDLVNFVCLSFIYREKMYFCKEISNLLETVRSGRVTFSEAIKDFP